MRRRASRSSTGSASTSGSRDKGITWSVGRTFSGDDEVYTFNLKADSVSEQPPFINLQQFYLEWFLVDRIRELGPTRPALEEQGRRASSTRADGVAWQVETPAGALHARGRLADRRHRRQQPDPRRSSASRRTPSRSTDRWCISDVRFKKPLPIERWTWVDAPFNEGRAVWQHLMADDVWRIDYQMAEDCRPGIDQPARGRRARACASSSAPTSSSSSSGSARTSTATTCSTRSAIGRVFFIGDAAHVVSPFGARGGNTGIQDAANLGWKLALVLQGPGRRGAARQLRRRAPRRRRRENLQVTSRTARFLAPRSPAEHRLRRAVVDLARTPRVRARARQHRPHVAGQRLPAVAVGAGGRALGAERRLRRHDA